MNVLTLPFNTLNLKTSVVCVDNREYINKTINQIPPAKPVA
jgi:hypothetical protein